MEIHCSISWQRTVTLLFTVFQTLVLPSATATNTHGFPSSYDDWLTDTGESSYEHSIFIGIDDNVAVHWKIEDEDTLHLAVAVKNTTGWLGFGIAENGGMPGSDIVIFETDTNDVTDTYATAYATPTVDCIQSWNLVNYVVDDIDEMILFEVTRALDTNDPQDRKIVNDSLDFQQAHRVIAAWGDTPTFMYHGENRAKGTIRFFQSSSTAKSEKNRRMRDGVYPLDAYSSFNLTVPDYEIPDDEVTIYADFYYDSSYEGTPEIQSNIHIVGFRFIEYPPTIKYIHHIVLYGHKSNGSKDLIYAWAPGMEDVILPEEAGFLVGSDGYSSVTMNVHYDNRDLDEGQIDQTGIQLFYTETLRENNAGVMQIGDGEIILSGQSATLGVLNSDEASLWEFNCPCKCLNDRLGGAVSEVTVFANSLHMHEIGASMKTLLYRDSEVIFKSEVNYFDFEAGGVYMPPQEPYTVKAGDSFKTQCYFKSEEDVPFGIDSFNEMCIDFVYYYPDVLPVYCGHSADDTKCYSRAKNVKTTDECMERTFGGLPSTCSSSKAKDVGDRNLQESSCPEAKCIGLFDWLF